MTHTHQPAHRPRKRFGQHFLTDHNIITAIVQVIAPRPGQNLVEIGPGQGALTMPLLERSGTLTVIELDRDLAPRLREAAEGRITVIEADVLTVNLSKLAGAAPMRLVGNLPYNISTPILFHCMEHLDALLDMHFMLQREVVERMAAPPGSKTYGRLSVMLQLACDIDHLIDVPPTAFDPPPKVDSAVVRLTPLPAADRLDPALQQPVAAVVKAAFAQRRKTLSNALRELLTADAIRTAGIDPGSRAEQLAPADFVKLAQALA